VAVKVHCAYEPGWFSHDAFREVEGDLVHWVQPHHFAANGMPYGPVSTHGLEHVAAERELSEDEVKGLTSMYREEQ
jgi:hypothetical protein